MRIFFVTIAQLSCVVSVALALIPPRPAEELGEGLHRLQSVSTELTLGNNWNGIAHRTGALAPRPAQNEQPWHLSLAMDHRWSPERAEPTAPEPEGIPFHDLSPQLPHSSSDVSTTSSLRPLPQLPEVGKAATSGAAPQLDPVFSNLILDESSGLMKLPRAITSTDSGWFDPIYEQMLWDFRGHSWKDQKLKIPPGWMETLTRTNSKFFHAPSPAFMLRLEPEKWGRVPGITEPREVILRHHAMMTFTGEDQHQNLLSSWSTTDNGKRLVLMGIYHSVPRGRAEKFFKFVGAEGYTMVPTKKRHADIYLVSRNDPQHDANVEKLKYSEDRHGGNSH
ncbi:uncharacterized protein UTRI_01125 [Ustilago trichophora]|uniref:Effector family protein Eff1 n=1 Tax=Ustilago trichophora TaxID=86804 RepID=A0A5C3DYR6_9BASI|nr:uncharacterized protein UTRI_01125 [Ustilago trichophora]